MGDTRIKCVWFCISISDLIVNFALFLWYLFIYLLTRIFKKQDYYLAIPTIIYLGIILIKRGHIGGIWSKECSTYLLD